MFSFLVKSRCASHVASHHLVVGGFVVVSSAAALQGASKCDAGVMPACPRPGLEAALGSKVLGGAAFV